MTERQVGHPWSIDNNRELIYAHNYTIITLQNMHLRTLYDKNVQQFDISTHLPALNIVGTTYTRGCSILLIKL